MTAMTLFEYLELHKDDFDTCDTEYDAIVTVCYIDESDVTDNYDRFCTSIIKKVEVVSCENRNLIVNWSALIKNNMDKFKAFTKEYWNNQYEDDEDEFIYQWISEIHLYIAGYVGEKMYGKLNSFIETLE